VNDAKRPEFNFRWTQPDDPGKLLIQLAKLPHYFRDADYLQDIFEKLVGQLTSEELLEIAKAARSFQSPQSGYMPFKWINKRYHTNHEAVDGLAQHWRDICMIYLSYSSHTSCDNAVAATLRVSCGTVEAHFLELEAQYMSSGQLLTSDSQKQVSSILEKTKTKHGKLRSLLELSQKIGRGDYVKLKFHDAVETAQTLCNLIDNMEYKTYKISMDDKDAAWYGLGCKYTDVAKFVAENSLAKSKRWETNPWHDSTHPYDFLEQAVRCFSQGIGFKLAEHYT
jgi:hypothetical protein